jgi:hypothetical protein
MRAALSSIRLRLDRVGIALSGLCALHCLAGIALVSFFGFGSVAGEGLFSPSIHRIGLALAIGLAFVTLGIGALRHGQRGPLVLGGLGILLMFAGLFAPHGLIEAMLTIAGVVLVALAHIQNLRQIG